MDTRELLNSALRHGRFTSLRAMARALGVSANTLVRIRKGHGYPSDELCHEFATIAGVDPYTALLQLNAERSEGKARRLYEKAVRERVSASLAAE